LVFHVPVSNLLEGNTDVASNEDPSQVEDVGEQHLTAALVQKMGCGVLLKVLSKDPDLATRVAAAAKKDGTSLPTDRPSVCRLIKEAVREGRLDVSSVLVSSEEASSTEEAL